MFELKGNWKAGWALDLHTISSKMNLNGKFDTVYTNIGWALYQLKYHQDYNQIPYLSDAIIQFMGTRLVTNYIDVILPIPPSKYREIQPVYEIAWHVGQGINKQVDFNYIQKVKSTSELKSIQNQSERMQILRDAFRLRDKKYIGKKILLLDDLYRSGSTLKEITRVLYEQGKVSNVYVVTLTKTRANK